MKPKIVYNQQYNIGILGLEKLHPFDSRKYGRAWKLLQQHFGDDLLEQWVDPERPVSYDELCMVHTSEYLQHELRSSGYLAKALEIPLLRFLPQALIDYSVLRPMRWSTMGSIIAAKLALETGCAVNLSGGYHHAKPSEGEGFCIYNDIAIAIHQLRREGLITADDKVLYVDVDAHQGNGVAYAFMHDPSVVLLDIYNEQIYPSDQPGINRLDYDLPVPYRCKDPYYKELLWPTLEQALRDQHYAFAIFNAGTDVYMGDTLGGMKLSARFVLERDLFVMNRIMESKIPVMMLLSGGYSLRSHRMIADTITHLLE